MIGLERDINLVLSGWNPIGVSDGISLIEYQGYVSGIIKALHLNSKEGVVNHLANILSNEMGLPYDPNNDQHLKDLENIALILMVLKEEASN